MANTSTSTRSKTEFYLLGSTITELTGSKLPSIRMALGLFLHHHIELNKTIRESSTSTIEEITKFWKKPRIPVQELRNSQPKLEKLFEQWRLLKKNKNRNTVTQKSKENEFVSKFDNLFDIAHANALKMIKISEDKDFLLAQREKGRRGFMLGVDKCLEKREKMADLREKASLRRSQRMKKICEEAEATVQLLSSDESDDLEHEKVEHASFTDKKETCTPKRNKKQMKIMTPYLAAALDRKNVSDRKAVFVVAETARSLGCDVHDVTVSRSSIRRKRMKHRSNMFEQLKTEFQEQGAKLTVHWDGKLLQDLTEKEKVDRLPVIVSGNRDHQLLSVAKLPLGTRESQAAAVYAVLQDWGLADNDKVCAMCFDTTSVNTGQRNGTRVLLEQKINKELLYLACRHHIMELVIGAVFNKCIGSSSAPEVPLFKRFQAYWEFIDKEKYKTGIDNKEILAQVAHIKDDIIKFSEKLLDDTQSRDDYREFLELILIFLGKTPSRGIRFMAPGAMHHARRMSKTLYSLKIWMFSCRFTISPREEKGLQRICIFAVHVYLKAWMMASSPQNAPYNDFNLMKSLLHYKNIEEVSKVASAKLANHLWYLSEDLVALALFDNQVPHCLKRIMIKAMKKVNGRNNPAKRPDIKLKTFMDMKFEDFVIKRSALLFERMSLPNTFLQVDPEIWEDQEDYCKALKIVQTIEVVNDQAERGVALIKEFNNNTQ